VHLTWATNWLDALPDAHAAHAHRASAGQRMPVAGRALAWPHRGTAVDHHPSAWICPALPGVRRRPRESIAVIASRCPGARGHLMTAAIRIRWRRTAPIVRRRLGRHLWPHYHELDIQ